MHKINLNEHANERIRVIKSVVDAFMNGCITNANCLDQIRFELQRQDAVRAVKNEIDEAAAEIAAEAVWNRSW